MTYKEAYMAYETWEELEEAMKKDISTVLIFGLDQDRIKNIKAAGEEVLKIKNF